MLMEVGFLCQETKISKQLKLMESEIKPVANVFSETLILRAFTTFFITTWYLPSIHSLHLQLGYWVSGPVAQQKELVKYDFNLLKYIITMS